MTTRHSHDDTDALREALFGRSVVNERDAARAYDAAVAEHHGPDAQTNQSIGLLPEEEA